VQVTYGKLSKATNKNALADMYVKFFRWATDRLKGQDGIICFVTNNGFLDGIALDGMRKSLLSEFDQIYHLDLHGNVRKNPKLSGTMHNVFGIQVGVGITIAIRKAGTEKSLKFHGAPEFATRREKLQLLSKAKSIKGIEWETLTPDTKGNWITEGLSADFDSFLPMGSKEDKASASPKAIFQTYSRGAETARDEWCYDFHITKLEAEIKLFLETYNDDVLKWKNRGNDTRSVDAFVTYDDAKIKWSSNLKEWLKKETLATFDSSQIHVSLYRPFCKQFLYFDDILVHRRGMMPTFFPTVKAEKENMAIWMKCGPAPVYPLMVNQCRRNQ
jgi:predicted helicase